MRLALSAPIVMFGAGFLLKLLDRFPLLVWAGAGVLGWVAGELAAGDPFWERMGVSATRLETPLAAAGCGLVLAIAALVSRLGARAQRRES